LFFISGYSSLYFAADFDILARLGLEGVVYLTPLSDAKWTFDALVTVFLSNPVASFSIGMLALLLLMFVNLKSTTGLYFLLWLAIWGFNGSIGTFIGDAIFGMGTYAVAKAMEFSFSVLLVSGVFSVYFLYLIGVIVGRLYFAYLCSLLRKQKTNILGHHHYFTSLDSGGVNKFCQPDTRIFLAGIRKEYHGYHIDSAHVYHQRTSETIGINKKMENARLDRPAIGYGFIGNHDLDCFYVNS